LERDEPLCPTGVKRIEAPTGVQSRIRVDPPRLNHPQPVLFSKDHDLSVSDPK
jgi:hypothetical protein